MDGNHINNMQILVLLDHENNILWHCDLTKDDDVNSLDIKSPLIASLPTALCSKIDCDSSSMNSLPIKFFSCPESIQESKISKIALIGNSRKSFYEKILANLHDCVFVTDAEGITLYVNDTFEKFYGIPKESILGKTGINFLGNNQCSKSPIPMVIKEKKKITIEQMTYVNRKIVITATPVFNTNGDIEMIVENSRDVSEIEQLKTSLEKMSSLANHYRYIADTVRGDGVEALVVSNSPAVKAIMKNIRRISITNSTLLMLGESGTGKTFFAKYIHSISDRREGPFISINCATIPSTLVESELFGYLPGSFTGATKNGKIGLVELANSGTLFLDEVGELPLNVQAKILQLIQEQTFLPIGSNTARKINTRIIAATNRNLETLVERKEFREDLYYRLKVIELTIPPLRERPEDIDQFIYFFLNKFDKQFGYSHSVSNDAIHVMTRYKWPGNIRQLSNVIENLVVITESPIIDINDLPEYLSKSDAPDRPRGLDSSLEQYERELVLNAYNEYKNTYKVAEILGISQSKASRKIRKYLSYTK